MNVNFVTYGPRNSHVLETVIHFQRRTVTGKKWIINQHTFRLMHLRLFKRSTSKLCWSFYTEISPLFPRSFFAVTLHYLLQLPKQYKRFLKHFFLHFTSNTYHAALNAAYTIAHNSATASKNFKICSCIAVCFSFSIQFRYFPSALCLKIPCTILKVYCVEAVSQSCLLDHIKE